MPTPQRYQVKLNPNILSRAKIILGSLLALTTVLIVAGIYLGVQAGDFNKVFIQPFKQFAADLETATEVPSPSPVALFSPIPSASGTTSTSKSESTVIINQKAAPVQKTAPAAPNCISKNIREGEFASNKCYSEGDFDDLNYYLQAFNSSVFDLDSANSSMNITCHCRVEQECAFFKDSCARDQQQASSAQANIDKYRGIIKGIIAKGQ